MESSSPLGLGPLAAGVLQHTADAPASGTVAAASAPARDVPERFGVRELRRLWERRRLPGFPDFPSGSGIPDNDEDRGGQSILKWEVCQHCVAVKTGKRIPFLDILI